MLDLSCDRNRFPVVAKDQKGENVTFDLYYRRPTTEEVVNYNRSLFPRRNGKILNNVVATRIEYGLRILTGFQEGVLFFNGRPISSDPGSADFYADWKALLKGALAGTIANFAFRIFEAPGEADLERDENVPTDDGEDAPPFPTS